MVLGRQCFRGLCLAVSLGLTGSATCGCSDIFGGGTKSDGVAVGVFVGAFSLIGFVLLFSAIFSWLGLTDRTQALGLPDGSIRALIALVLLSAFISLPVYLYNSLNSELKFVDGVSAADKTDFINSLPKGQFAFAVPSGPANAQVYRIYYRDANSAGTDFAKEILTSLITLVASVSSFYFGAGVAKSAQAAGAGSQPPVITNIQPNTEMSGATVIVQVTGSNLDLVNRVSLVSGKREIQATDVTSNATLIKCSLAVPPGLLPGVWSVVVGTSDRKSASLDDAFNVTKADGDSEPEPKPAPPKVEPPKPPEPPKTESPVPEPPKAEPPAPEPTPKLERQQHADAEPEGGIEGLGELPQPLPPSQPHGEV